MVGDGAIDPLTQFTGFSELAFYMGFANLNEKAVMKVSCALELNVVI
jgi:hypothetical protein